MKPSAIPPARAQAALLLESILTQRQTLDEADLVRGTESDIKFARLLVLTALRHLGQIDTLLVHYLDKKLPVKRSAVTQALRLGVVQLLLIDTPTHAAVHETVALLKNGKDAGLAGLVNAVLQKIARDKPALGSPLLNLPTAVVARWTVWYGASEVKTMAQVASIRSPLDLTTRQTIDGAVRLDQTTVRLAPDHPPVESLPGYAEGAFFVQDIAASYPARLLGNVKGQQVLDIGAAPGGKTAQLVQAGAQVTALDRSAKRMRVLTENMARLGYTVETIVADACTWTPPIAYDAILLDAPCSATGTWRRHPEVVHIVTPADITELAGLQRALLDRAWQWLKPGGRLIYCVCSLEREEGEAQAEWFVDNYGDNVTVIPVDPTTEIPRYCITSEGYLRTLPSQLSTSGGMDGFFAVCFEKHLGS